MAWLHAPWVAVAVWTVARVCLVAMFPFSAAEKVWHWRNALAQTESGDLPGGKIVPVAVAMLAAAVAVEFVTPFCIVFGVYDRIAAFILAGFCFVTAFLYHPFWMYKDLWAPNDDSKGREHFWQFTKNFCIVGGLMLVMFEGTFLMPR